MYWSHKWLFYLVPSNWYFMYWSHKWLIFNVPFFTICVLFPLFCIDVICILTPLPTWSSIKLRIKLSIFNLDVTTFHEHLFINGFRFMVLNALFNNISVILVEEPVVPWENHRPVASNWQTLAYNVVSSTPRHE